MRKVAHLQLEKVDNDQDGGAVENSLDDKCKEVGKLKDTNWKESRYEIPRRPQTAVERIVSAGLVAGGEVLKARAQSIVWDAAKAGVEAAAREVVSVCTGNSGKI